MNRQRAAHLYLSPVHVQQGLFAVLALLITLIGGQQFLCRAQSQQPEAPHLSIRYPTQTHFSAVGSGQADSPPMRMMDVDQACLLYTSPSPRDGLLSRMPSSA